ncbi:MAG: Na/Pi cotransporter family protein [Clostridia bacterium]|nr:Na/Pi cotransporter family protein [Clostridia bacterium]
MWSDISVLLEKIFFMLGGMVVFMVGMKNMSQSLERVAGSKMRVLMSKISNNRFAGVGIGAAVTALMNSSSATTVMLVGFVNVGVISLTQATSIIMGANIGTTITAQFFAFAGQGDGISATGIFALLATVGLVLTMVAKKEQIRHVGEILIGLGFIFIGLKFLSGAVGDLVADDYWGEKIRGMFIAIGKGETFEVWQMILLFLLGVFLTGLLQSSAAITGLIISLAGQGLISIEMAIFITLGSNIGTCVTSILASFGASVNARRTAGLHLVFNVLGCVIFIIPMFWLNKIVADWLMTISSFGADITVEATIQHAIANFHLIFNVLTTLILLPFTNVLVKLVSTVIPEGKSSKKEKDVLFHFIDERFLETPAIAVPQVRKEILSMGDMAFENYKRSLKMLTEGDFSEKSVFDETEKRINKLNHAITSYCTQLSSREISDLDEKKISAFFRNVSDFERIGDYAQNLTEYAARLQEDGGKFSEAARREIAEVDENITSLYADCRYGFENKDLSRYEQLNATEETIDRLTNGMEEAHIGRLNEGICSSATGAVYLQVAGNLERIADHMVNVAKSVKTYWRKDVKPVETK